jgi:molecular chaperone DnaJ
VKIPAGVTSGNYIPVSGAGHAGSNGGPYGDAIVLIEEKAHKVFVRHGDDIVCEVPISFSQAALGDELEVPTLNSQHTIKIPSGAQSGKTLRLKNKGIPHLRGLGRGDQLVRLVVWTPTHLSREEKRLFEELAQQSGMKPPKGDRSFFEKLRETLGV